VSAWYHLVVSCDTNDATPVKIYINGTQQTLSGTQPSAYSNTGINFTSLHSIGVYTPISGNTYYFSGYLADIHFIDGAALTPSSFTETDATTGQLIPKTYTGGYGTNGFKLTFSDNSNNTAATLGADTSGNGNNWTPSATISVADGVTAGTGALPIYNTTSNNYLTKSTGTRTDSFSSSIALAVAMDGINGGTTFTDESAAIKGSGSAKSLTVTSVTTSTTASKFYGSSGYFGTGGSTQHISISPVNSFSNSSFTIEMWYYATASQNDRVLYRAVPSSHYGILLYMNAGLLQVYLSSNGSSWDLVSGTSIGYITTNQWTHIALVRNGSSFTGYMNGSSTSLTTSSSSIASATIEQIGGSDPGAGQLSFPGYIQDVRVYVGAAKYTGTFTVPSYNTSTAAGNDSLVDTPTNYGTDTGAGGEVRGNYCTLNPLDVSSLTTSDGNLRLVASAAGYVRGTMNLAGKTYWEVTITIAGLGGIIGIMQPNGTFPYTNSNGYHSGGSQYVNGSSVGSWGASWTTGDVISIAVDADAGTITAYKNGVSQGSKSIVSTVTWMSWIHSYDGTYFVNFGQRPFAYTAPSGFKALCTQNLTDPVVAQPSTVFDVKLWSGNSSTQTISGLGFSPDWVWIKCRNVAYDHRVFDTVRGYDKQLGPNITDPEYPSTSLTSFNPDGFSLSNAVTTNGSGTTQVAWCWDAGGEPTTDNVAGAGNVPTAGSAKVNGANMTTALAGSIAATRLSVNTSAGFSIVGYTGTGTAPVSVGHGLNVAPTFLIFKDRDSGVNWQVWTTAVSSNGTVLEGLNTTSAGTTPWTYISTTSSLIQFNSGNTAQTSNGKRFICYAFAPVAGYSSFGSYTGNGSADGPFVFTGFRPRWVLAKRTTAGSNWWIIDTARDTYNVTGARLSPNLSQQEYSGDYDGVYGLPTIFWDILSNGFKVRSAGGEWVNSSGVTYIYAAFAESPFKYARAR
jgi:hypothetical protein